MDLTAKRRDAAVFLSLVCILLASPAASISTAWPEQATYEKGSSRILARGLVAVKQAASASTAEIAATSTFQNDNQSEQTAGFHPQVSAAT
ncbi:unnamed protein product [Spirodela intermedia]|uniref:Uncharacterized protein n=1 Tax=Spirodela intermedia TaxID=51605 RepID=A0A7I8ITI3_SPIIN|nr:unnamed protein product [Spirodela intermedia]CAA6661184.1 unnamed protein product [Spirodela intermedia]